MGYIKEQPTLAVAVTPNNTAILSPGAQYPDAGSAILYIGGTGNLSVVTEGGQTVLFRNVPVGFFPVSVKIVRASPETTATNILALW
jgi:hypothetical protein